MTESSLNTVCIELAESAGSEHNESQRASNRLPYCSRRAISMDDERMTNTSRQKCDTLVLISCSSFLFISVHRGPAGTQVGIPSHPAPIILVKESNPNTLIRARAKVRHFFLTSSVRVSNPNSLLKRNCFEPLL